MGTARIWATRLWAKRLWATMAILALAAGVAAGENEAPAAPGPAAEPATPSLVLRAKAGDTFRFRRTRARRAVCEQLARRGDDSITVEFVVRVTSVANDGGLEVEIAFGEAHGHFTTTAGDRLAFDTSEPLPETPAVPDLVGLRVQTMLAGVTVTATLDARGNVVAVAGVREAAAAEFAGTQVAAAVADYPDAEARKDVAVFLPSLPAAEHAGGSTWKDERPIDFGASSRFGFAHEWTVDPASSDSASGDADAGGTVTIRAASAFEPGPNAPQGQNNVGEGTVVDVRAVADGFVSKRTVSATFTGTGNFEIEASFEETLERLPAAEQPR